MAKWLQQQWQTTSFWHIVLIPLSWVFGLLVYVRKAFYRLGWLKSTKLPVPVIIVGNISVGGTGKTPFVIWLAEQLQLSGCQLGIISRGYGGNAKQVTEVNADSHPLEVGDEPVLIAKRTHCPIFVGADRVAAGQALLSAYPQCNLLISDDGLQHYRLQRDVEIALINSNDAFGNQQLLPAGPMREKISRLKGVDAIVDSGITVKQKDYWPPLYNMQLQGVTFERVDGVVGQQSAGYFKDKELMAIAGIGKPERFFKQLSTLGLQFEQQAFADHHAYNVQDLAPFAHKTLLMTEKDAVKCQQLKLSEAWYLPVRAEITGPLNPTLIGLILNKLKMNVSINNGY
ncbi:MAG: tetraacyldisaccharide 4'-kinase [Methylophilaceae bacterium]